MTEQDQTKPVATEATRRTNPKRRTSDKPKTSVALKRLWHAWKKEGNRISLKKFAKSVSTNPLVKEWVNHKRGSLEKLAKAERLKNKGTIISLQKSATKLARRKVKGGSKPSVV